MKPPLSVLLVGSGNLGKAIGAHLEAKQIPFTDWGARDGSEVKEGLVVCYVGKKRHLEFAIPYCERHKVPLIMGSTGLDDDLPAKPECVIVKAPNFALPIVGLIALLPELTRYFARLGVTPYCLVESHQQTKTGTPGTAVAIQQALGVHAFTSVREPAIQVKLGVPPEHLAGHGYHWMTFEGGAVTLGINTQVNGRAAYAPGFVQLAEATLSRMHTGFAQIRKGVYTSAQILELDKLKIVLHPAS